MDADMWTALPYDLLVDIFRRLDATAVIRCAATCRPWRRAVIDNASCLRPRPDCFNPNLLIGFLEKHWRSEPTGRHRHTLRRLQHVPASNTSAPSFTPAAGIDDDDVVDDGRLYSDLISSRDGFLLFQGQTDNSLCLCRPLTGTCRALPAAAFDDFITGSGLCPCVYVLFTSYDVDGGGGSVSGNEPPAVWILAADCPCAAEDGLTYQIFSSVSGEWGPIKRSAKFPDDDARNVFMDRGDVVVGRGTVDWLVALVPHDSNREGGSRLLAMDLRTERTWTTELPDLGSMDSIPVFLATSEEGRLSLVKMFSDQMEVWVLAGDEQWTLRRTLNFQNLIPNCCPISMRHTWLTGFSPRSGCLFGYSCGDDDESVLVQQHLLIGIDGGFIRLIPIDGERDTRLPYEMDWSTYISKM